jgi:uncharacterized protein YndB with AHSA1/START domain
VHPRYSISIDINAPPERVFEVMTDVERWHEWTPSIHRITRKQSGPLVAGETATVRQPKLPPARWTVNEIQPGRSFSWFNRAPGLKVTGFHGAEPTSSGSRATLSLSYEGIFGGLLARMTEGITKKYIEMEAKGLKARAENPSYRHS